MQHYGKFWLTSTGLDFSRDSLSGAAMNTLIFGCWLLALGVILFWKKRGGRPLMVGIVFSLTVVFLLARMGDLGSSDIIRILFFPPDTVFNVAIAVVMAGYSSLRDPGSTRKLAVALAVPLLHVAGVQDHSAHAPHELPHLLQWPWIFFFSVPSFPGRSTLGYERSRARIRVEVGISAACLFAVAYCVFPIGPTKESREASSPRTGWFARVPQRSTTTRPQFLRASCVIRILGAKEFSRYLKTPVFTSSRESKRPCASTLSRRE